MGKKWEEAKYMFVFRSSLMETIQNLLGCGFEKYGKVTNFDMLNFPALDQEDPVLDFYILLLYLVDAHQVFEVMPPIVRIGRHQVWPLKFFTPITVPEWHLRTEIHFISKGITLNQNLRRGSKNFHSRCYRRKDSNILQLYRRPRAMRAILWTILNL